MKCWQVSVLLCIIQTGMWCLSLICAKKIHGTYFYSLANNGHVPMLLVSRLRNTMLPGCREVLLLQEGSFPWPCALVGPALGLFHGAESVGPVGHACLESEPFHGRPYFKYLGSQNFLPEGPWACFQSLCESLSWGPYFWGWAWLLVYTRDGLSVAVCGG